MEIIKKLNAVMETVGNVRKAERNQAQGFNFRGIDAVVNAVSPALRKEGVVVVPMLLASDYETVTIGKNATQMGHARVTVEYRFYAADGSNVAATVAAEAMDSGDKATAKAMSVAFRTALLQALCLPTDETDPDAESFERSPKAVAESTPQAKRKTTGISAPHQKAIAAMVETKHPGEDAVVFCGDLLGRTLKSLADIQDDEKDTLIKKLAGA